jgi:hypothetical protein
MSDSYLEINNLNKDLLIISFGGCALKLGGILPFECLKSLTIWFPTADLRFIIDKNHAYYHKGIDGISTTISETKEFLEKISNGYKKVIFIGTSAGGYAAILFGSLLNISHVISFIPQTILTNNDFYDKKYTNLASVINNTTQYTLYGDTSISNINDLHHIRHVENIDYFSNVHAIYMDGISLPKMRDNGELKQIITSCIESQM